MCELDALLDSCRRSGHVGEVERASVAGASDGFLAALDPLAKRGARLVGQSVVVLDDVDAAGGEAMADVRELGRVEPDRFERPAQERACGRRGGHRPQGLDPVGRTAERFEQRVRPLDPRDDDPALERDVAEQQIGQLCRIAADQLRVVGDRGRKASGLARLDTLHTPDDALRDRLADAGRGQFDGLLVGDVPGLVPGVLALTAEQPIRHF